MNDNAPALPDDAALAGLLERAGSALDPNALRGLIAGVLAAPPGHDPDSWMALVADKRSPRLRDALRALKVAMARDLPPPALPAAAERLGALRALLTERGLDGFLVPRGDEFGGEYVPARAERLAWLTGFTGSAGEAVVLRERAALFVDGRYTLQAEAEVDTGAFALQPLAETPPALWLERMLTQDQQIGFDPWLHSEAAARRLQRACARAGAELVAVDENPIDALWADQPPPPLAPVVPHPNRYAGETSAAKRKRVAAALTEAGVDALFIGSPDAVAWLLNIRGGDVPYTPLPLGFVLIDAKGAVDLFIDPRKLTAKARNGFGPKVAVQPLTALGPALDRLGRKGVGILADPAHTPIGVCERLAAGGAERVRGVDPVPEMRACKNKAELRGLRACHLRDAAAVARLLAWLDREAPSGHLDEIGVADRLEALRAEDSLFRGPSFPTIAGSGPNGAIVHYRVSEASNRPLDDGSLLLLDSGAQYLDGTTDITRTVAIGTPAAAMRRAFTLVLKGHIALSELRFPAGTSGGQIDAIARRDLWAAGLDYDHGTGHGVGSYLGVHEGPARIGKQLAGAKLKPGMVLSNEPGFYKAGEYGIRIENLIAVTEAEALAGGERPMHGFEVLTLAPIDRRLIDTALLSEREIAWLDAYHDRVREAVSPLVDADTAAWLKAATAPL